MASPSRPHDINSTNEIHPKCVRYDNNYSLGNVQPTYEGGGEVGIVGPNVGFDGVDDQHVIEIHLENL
jgi:hypothetical protein